MFCSFLFCYFGFGARLILIHKMNCEMLSLIFWKRLWTISANPSNIRSNSPVKQSGPIHFFGMAEVGDKLQMKNLKYYQILSYRIIMVVCVFEVLTHFF